MSTSIGSTKTRRLGVLRQRTPGVVLALVLGGCAVGITELTARIGIEAVGGVACAIVIGIVWQAIVGVRSSQVAGVKWVGKSLVKGAVILLGFRFGVGELLDSGFAVLGVLVAVIAVSFIVSLGLGRKLGVDPRLSLLIGTGSGICGNSAIAAAAPVVKARDRDVSFAAIVVTLFGTVAMVTFPILGALLGMSDQAFGTFAGAGIHDAAQAVGSGFTYSEEAGAQAVIVKLTRTMFLIPIVVALVMFVARRGSSDEATSTTIRRAIPWFALGFLAASALRTVGDILWDDGAGWLRSIDVLAESANIILIIGMTGVGLLTTLGSIRSLGTRPLIVGLVTAIAVSGTALGGALLVS